jgi:hypothetical protein
VTKEELDGLITARGLAKLKKRREEEEYEGRLNHELVIVPEFQRGVAPRGFSARGEFCSAGGYSRTSCSWVSATGP